MKSIHFKILLICVFSLTALLAQAQDNKPAISIGPDLFFPINTTNNAVRNIYKDGVGGDVKLEWTILKSLKFTVSAGFVSFGDKQILETPNPTVIYYNINQPNTNQSNNTYRQLPFRFIPLTAGLQYYLIKYFYIDGSIGDAVRFGDNNGNIVTDQNGKVYSNGNNEYSSFIWSGGVGVNIPVTKHNAIDFGVRYENGYKTPTDDYAMGVVALRLAYKYKF